MSGPAMTEAEKLQYMKDGSIDINNFLSDDYNTFKKKIFTLAVSNTQQYFEDREAILKLVKHELTSNMFKTVYNLLTMGKDAKGSTHIVVFSGKELAPRMPVQQVQNQAISCANAIHEMLTELIDDLFPLEADDIFKKKLITQANTTTAP